MQTDPAFCVVDRTITVLQILVCIVRQSLHADFFPKYGPHLVCIASEKSTLMNLLNTNYFSFQIRTNVADIGVFLFNGDKTSLTDQ